MSIIILNPWEKVIGPNRYLIELLRHLPPEILDKILVVFDRPSNALDEYRLLGVEVAIWSEIQPVFLDISFKNFWSLFKRHTVGLIRLFFRLRKLQPDLIFSNTEMLLISQWAAFLIRKPHLQIFHAISFQYRLGHHSRLLSFYLKYMSFWNKYLIGVSRTLVETLIDEGVAKDKTLLLPNPIPHYSEADLNSDHIPLELSQKMERHYPVLVSAGKFSPMKGQDLLIEALPQVKQAYPEFLCIFVGNVGASDGLDNTTQFMQNLRNDIMDNSLAEHILMIGEIDYLPALLARSDIYIQPSRTESFGRVAAEALLCGTPVIAFDVGALREVIGPGGVIVPFPKTQKITHAMRDILTDNAHYEQYVSDGKLHIQESFSANYVADKFMYLIEQLKVE